MREGPTVTVRTSCRDCKWLHADPYRCQSDSGIDYTCTHPTLGEKTSSERYVGDSRTDTPAWCPVGKTEGEGNG